MATWQAAMFQATDLMESMQAKQAKRATHYAPLHSTAPIMTKSSN
jgi:hypothetical protein